MRLPILNICDRPTASFSIKWLCENEKFFKKKVKIYKDKNLAVTDSGFTSTSSMGNLAKNATEPLRVRVNHLGEAGQSSWGKAFAGASARLESGVVWLDTCPENLGSENLELAGWSLQPEAEGLSL